MHVYFQFYCDALRNKTKRKQKLLVIGVTGHLDRREIMYNNGMINGENMNVGFSKQLHEDAHLRFVFFIHGCC